MTRNTTAEICGRISMPEPVRKELETLEKHMFRQTEKELELLIEKLTVPKQWEQARRELKERLCPDERGMKMLLCMLKAAEKSLEKYQKAGIEEKIFTDTMKCFTRFVTEHMDSFGTYGFDRDFWTGRQLSLLLFRIGELEYEKTDKGEISIHIPSDADLSPEKCRSSIEEAKCFFTVYDPAYGEAPYTCTSWLLSPALAGLLPEESRIRRFQELFAVSQWHRESEEFLSWVYKRSDIPLESLPEDTSLQRNMKEYLRKGGKVGEGEGVLKEREKAGEHGYHTCNRR